MKTIKDSYLISVTVNLNLNVSVSQGRETLPAGKIGEEVGFLRTWYHFGQAVLYLISA